MKLLIKLKKKNKKNKFKKILNLKKIGFKKNLSFIKVARTNFSIRVTRKLLILSLI